MDIEDLPENMTVLDSSGVPDHVVNFHDVVDDGFRLALWIGAADGDQDQIISAIKDVQTKWGDRDGYVLTSAISQFSRDLLPAYAQLARTASGVDFAKHCRTMLQPGDYDPESVDVPSPEQSPSRHPVKDHDAMGGSALKVRKGEPSVPTRQSETATPEVPRNYLERIVNRFDHITELAEFGADHASSGGTYELDNPDARELVRDLLHSITTDAQQASLLMDNKAPRSPWGEPHYIEMSRTYIPPDEAQVRGYTNGESGMWHRRALRTDMNQSAADVTPLFRRGPNQEQPKSGGLNATE